MKTSEFAGFSPETFDFLWGIRLNNNKEWFAEHKKDYVDRLYEPMKALGQAAFRPFLDRPGNLLKVSRIYRDARMHYPVPYKESLWLCIRQDVEWWAENPCLYFEIRPEGASAGFLFWKPKTAILEAFRQDLIARPEVFPKIAEKCRKATGLPLTAEVYKRPKPCPIPELEPYFAWKGDIECTTTWEPGEALFDPKLGDELAEMFENLLPLYDYFGALTAKGV